MLMPLKRLLKHKWLEGSGTPSALPHPVLQQLEQQVAASERLHTGEIRIYIESSLPGSYLWTQQSTEKIVRQRALDVFSTERVWDTADNNGVLVYVLLAERAIELVADRGINQRVSPEVWQGALSRMTGAFRAGHFETGLTQALAEVTALLVEHFPLAAGAVNSNELPDFPVSR